MLPPPGPGVYWKRYEITTPTFRLSPVEKPDFSPFLIHMTGKQSLIDILKGNNTEAGVTLEPETGFLKASIPDYNLESCYNSKVVCFTESPIHALDFFRYKNFRRWKRDQRFGIGFSKERLFQFGARPIVCTDTKANSGLLYLCNMAESGHVFSEVSVEDLYIKETLKKIKPLLFPMLEYTKDQGFMWEREWRYPDENGLIFRYSSISIICCPTEEKAEILDILGDHADNIIIIESWKEYDEVTNYLKNRSTVYPPDHLDHINDLSLLNELKLTNAQTLNAIVAYSNIFVGVADDHTIQAVIQNLKEKEKAIQRRISAINSQDTQQ